MNSNYRGHSFFRIAQLQAHEGHLRTKLHPGGRHLHEVVKEVLISVLVAGHLHLIFSEHVVVHVVLLPLEPLSFLGQFGIFLLLQSSSVPRSTCMPFKGFFRKPQPTFSCCAMRSIFLNSLSLSSFSCLKSGCFSTLVLFKRLTIAFSRALT